MCACNPTALIILEKNLILSTCIDHISAAGSAPAPVLDAHGKALRAGVKYLVKPADKDGYIGGFGLVEVLTKHCPAVVGQLLGKQKGQWLTFIPANPKERVIRLSTDVNIKFPGSNSCNESNVWQLKYNKALEQYAVMVEVYCKVTCKDVGIVEDKDGWQHLALSNDPLSVTFYLCSTGTPFMWPYPSWVLVGDGNAMGTRRGRFLNVSNVRDVSDRSIQPVSIYF
ncbi:putative proteinase inhibitor I3, Kunitz legume, kunitz inhibitor STI-like superfamily [Helianthus anomalus]